MGKVDYMNPLIKKTLADDAKEALFQYISHMDLQQSTKLPAETVLAEQLGVSRVTIRRAIDELECSGILLRQHGRGTFVNPNAAQISVNLNTLCGFGDIIKNSGHAADSQQLHCAKEKAGCHAVQLGLHPGESIWQVVTLYTADGSPAIMTSAFFSEQLLPETGDTLAWEQESVPEFLYHNTGLLMASDKLRVRACSRQEAAVQFPYIDRLHTDALLMMDGVAFDQNNQPLFYGVSFYDTSVIQFDIFRRR